MLNVLWILWAFRFAGMIETSYSILILATILLIVISAIWSLLKVEVNKKIRLKELDEIGKKSDDDKEGVLALLMLIYTKLK